MNLKGYARMAREAREEGFEEIAIWQCSNCGHIVIGPSAPEICPVCDHPQSYFQVLAQNY